MYSSFAKRENINGVSPEEQISGVLIEKGGIIMQFNYVSGVLEGSFPEIRDGDSYDKRIELILNDASSKVDLDTNSFYRMIELSDNLSMEQVEKYTENHVIEKRYDSNSSDITRLSLDKQIRILCGGTYTERKILPCICYSVVDKTQLYYCVRYYAK